MNLKIKKKKIATLIFSNTLAFLAVYRDLVCLLVLYAISSLLCSWGQMVWEWSLC